MTDVDWLPGWGEDDQDAHLSLPDVGAPPLHGTTCEQYRLAAVALSPADGRRVVLVVAGEWFARKGGVSAFNRLLCRGLVLEGVRVLCTVVNPSEEERRDAEGCGVELIEVPRCGDSVDAALGRRPELPVGVLPDVIIGHGRFTGRAARNLAEGHFPRAKRVHFIHVAPDELEWLKIRSTDAGRRAEVFTAIEMELGRAATCVVAIGPLLFERFRSEFYGKGLPEPIRIDPGFDHGIDRRTTPPPGLCRVLLLGRAEDESIKGLDLAAAAMGRVIGRVTEDVEWIVRGAPEGQAEDLRRRLHHRSNRPNLWPVVREYSPDPQVLKEDLRRASLVIMPSRTDAFGMVGVDAIAAGTPVLVSSASGLGRLIREVLPPADAARFVVSMSGDDETDADEWARAVERCLSNRESAFKDAAMLGARLADVRTWSDVARTLLAAVDVTALSQ